MKDPATAAAKWARNMAAAGPTITAGVNATTVNPAQQAIAQLPVAAANYAAAINSGKTAAALGRTTLQGWQQGMLKKGLQNIANGASMAQPKVQAFMQQLIPAVQSAVASLPPRGTKAQNQQRMLQFSEAMSNFKRS